MFNVEAVPGVSIVIRSKDPNFSPNNMVFVTEYAGMGSSTTTTPLQLSILKESDQNGQLIRISVMNPNNGPTGRKPTNPISPVSSYGNLSRIPSPSSMTYQRTSTNPTGYPSPSPSIVHQIPFPSSDSGSSHTSSSSAVQSDVIDFGDFGDALNFQDAFPTTYGDLNAVLGGGTNSSDQLRASQYYSSDALMNSSSYPIPTTSAFLTTAPMIHDPALSPPPHTNHTALATPLVSSPSSLPSEENNASSSSTSSPTSSSASSSSLLPAPSSSSSSDQNDPKRIYTCRHEGCEKRFARKYHRQVHENSHKPKVRMLLTCREGDCTAKFGRPHDRMRHEVAKHGLRPNFVCKECGKFFGTESKLRGHKCDLMPSQRHRWTEPDSNDI